MKNLPVKISSTIFLYVTMTFNVHAEVDKVYHPYVEYGAYEFESRLLSHLEDDNASDFSLYRFGFGKDFSEKIFLEFYVIGKKQSESRVDVEAFEIEALYQIGEQGEYWADWGILLEVEKERRSNEWEGNIGILIEKEFGRWSGTFNLHQQYFYEDDLQHEWSTNAALQIRHRLKPTFEPAIELYSSDESLAFGPVVLGEIKFATSKINWEVGIMKETKSNLTGNLLRAVFEYEF